MSDTIPLKPGEIDLESGEEGGAEPPIAEEPQAATPAGEEPPAAEGEASAVEEPPPPVEAKVHRGAVAELIEKRTAVRELSTRIQQFENDPAIQRLTPEVRQALLEGRIVVTPPKTNADVERDRLTKLAERLDLRRADGTPDTDAAARVGSVIRDEVQEIVKPVVQHQQQTIQDRTRAVAADNIDKAVAAAKANGWDEAFVRQEYEAAAALNPQLVANPNVAMQLWHTTVGKLHAAGKLPAAKAPPPSDGRAPAAAPVIAEAPGRRAPATATTLTAKQKQVYQEHGLDPAKAYSTTLSGPIDLSKGLALED